ncbi:O-acetylhomoserine aminocarboxypropyltransferase/cysteine synthase family protein [Luedemannella flava]
MSPGFETTQIHAATEPDGPLGARQVPIYPGNAFLLGDFERAARLFSLDEQGPIYTRMGNPTIQALEGRICALEGGSDALAVASGQAAEMILFLNAARAGEHIVASPVLYGGSTNLLRRTLYDTGIDVTTVADPQSPSSWAAAIRPNTKLLFVETIGNPTNSVYDLSAIAAVAHQHGVLFAVDNTAATPYLFRPLEVGADLVLHSATKFLGGHGTAVAGVIVEGSSFDYASSGRYPRLMELDPGYRISFCDRFPSAPFVARARYNLLRDLGPALSPFTAWAALQGIETLSLRMQRHVENAVAVACWLDTQRDVEGVGYAGLPSSPYRPMVEKYLPRGAGAVFCFDIAGGPDRAIRFVQALRLFSHAANIGDIRSLVMHPASTTHSQMDPSERAAAGVTDTMVRLSIGLETADDLIADLAQALQASASC